MPVNSIVLDLDEMGPIRACPYAGQQAIAVQERPSKRATYELERWHGDQGRRQPRGYVFGALWERTGSCWTQCYPARRTVHFLDFLCEVDAQIPAWVERIYVILDNLNVHHSADLLLFSLHHPRWEWVHQPTYAAYLNLIEPWWKILRSLALKGQHFHTWQEVSEAVERATAYWNAHKHPFLWGRRRRHQPRRAQPRSPFARYLKRTPT